MERSQSVLSYGPLHTLRKSCLKDPTKAASPGKEYELKNVFFHEAEIREYPQVLGDNPAVSDGAPVAIAWEFQDQYTVNIDVYEITRAPLRRRKGRRRLMMSSKRRFHRLIDAGYTAETIGAAIVAVDNARSERLESVRDTGWNGSADFLTGTVQTTGWAVLKGSAILKAGRKGWSNMFMGSMNAKLPRKKSITNPAC